MAGDGKIHVYFHSAEGEASKDAENTGGGQDGSAAVTRPKSNNAVARSAIASMGIDYGKKAINYGLSVLGDVNGDYQSQRTIQTALDGISTAIMMSQFPYGTVAGAFQIGTSIITNLIQTKNANIESELIRKRTGNEVLNNSEGE